MARDNSWADPGPHDLGHGVFRIPLPMPADGLRAVNVYALVADSGITMIDAGWATPESESELARALGDLGAGLQDIRRFLVTHAHRDHYSLAVALRDRLGIPASVGRGEAASLRVLGSTTPSQRAVNRARRLARAGAVELAAQIAAQPTYRDSDLLGYDEDPDHWLEDDEDLEGGLRAIATPGHTFGHMVFLDSDLGMLFSGDHVLPYITPSVGNEAAPTDWPLRDYLASLSRIRALPDARLLPAHGPVLASTHARIDELLAHHEERLAASLALLGEASTTAFDGARGLPWTYHRRDFTELDAGNRAMAVLETAAHLDVLMLRGLVERHEADGTVGYRRVA